MQVGRGSVWSADSIELVTPFSELTGRPTGATKLGTIPAAVAVGRSVVWWLDPANLSVTQTTFFGHGVAAGPPTLDLAFGEGALWVASYDDGTVVRIDPTSGNVSKEIRVGGHPSGIAVGDGKVWVTVS